ncbi:SDR family oxidoreductase [Luteibacter sp. CQ10]
MPIRLHTVTAAVIASRAAARVMTRGGRIIRIGSTHADRMPFAGGAVYAMTKAALRGMTKGLARDLGRPQPRRMSERSMETTRGSGMRCPSGPRG